MSQGEYAQAGVDYSKIEPFKMAMKAVGKRTLKFPEERGVYVESLDHGCSFCYKGAKRNHTWCQVTEGLGNKNWIAEWMYQNVGTGRTYYEGIGIDAALMAVNDLVAQGAMPVLYTDEVAAGDSDWFQDQKRANDLAESFFKVCQIVGMALPAGESPSLRYLVNAAPPVKSAPSLSGCATGIIVPCDNEIVRNIQVGDRIIGVPSSGLHANGVSLVIKRAMGLPDKFLTRLPNGNTLGEEALIPTVSYVALVEKLIEADVCINCLLPGTGDGVGKIAFDKNPFTYRIYDWPEVPEIFQFLRSLGVSLIDCLKTFNWGVGYYIFVPEEYAEIVIELGIEAGYEPMEVDRVEEGPRQVIFGPENDLILPPPGE